MRDSRETYHWAEGVRSVFLRKHPGVDEDVIARIGLLVPPHEKEEAMAWLERIYLIARAAASGR